jgi:hypothetical protein
VANILELLEGLHNPDSDREELGLLSQMEAVVADIELNTD